MHVKLLGPLGSVVASPAAGRRARGRDADFRTYGDATRALTLMVGTKHRFERAPQRWAASASLQGGCAKTASSRASARETRGHGSAPGHLFLRLSMHAFGDPINMPD